MANTSPAAYPFPTNADIGEVVVDSDPGGEQRRAACDRGQAGGPAGRGPAGGRRTLKPLPVSPGALDRRFLGHPSGLGVLAFTEGWVMFSYYGMQSLLVLYMTGTLLRPGHVEHVLGFDGFRSALGLLYGAVSGQALASAIMGLYSALVFATPILGGLLADRLLGRTRSIILGAVLMTIGHFLMAFEASFLIALACLVCGMGCAANTKAQVGGLYALSDARRADAFQIYMLAVQIAVIIAPLVCGTLGETYAWHWGFAAAGVGMLLGLVVYLAGRRTLPPEPVLRRAARQPGSVAHSARASRPALSRREWGTLAILAGLLPVFAIAAVGNMEIFNGYLLWSQQNYDLVFFGRHMPVSWLLSLDAVISAGALVLTVLFWRWWSRRHRDPDEIVKMACGAGVLVLAPLVLAAASAQATGPHQVGLGWGLAFHIVNSVGFSSFYAVGMALYSRAAPAALGGTVVNAFSLHVFLANLLVGWLAGLLGRMSATSFWLLHAGLIAGAALAIAAAAVLFRNVLAPGPPHMAPDRQNS